MTFNSFGGGASSPINPDTVYEPLGFGATGEGTSVTTGASNTKGSAAAIGTTVAEWAGFVLNVYGGSSGTARYIFDISIDGGSTWAVSNHFTAPSNTIASCLQIEFPINVPAGSAIQVRAQAATATATLKVGIEGRVKSATSRLGFAQSVGLSADTAATRPNTVNVPLTSSIAWTPVQTLAGNYGALLAAANDISVAHATSQDAIIALATGTPGNEIEFYRWSVTLRSSLPSLAHAASPLIQKTLTTGQIISACCLTATPGSDVVRVGIQAFS